jgi:hypothetical protein
LLTGLDDIQYAPAVDERGSQDDGAGSCGISASRTSDTATISVPGRAWRMHCSLR